uniref:Innexin n=1 Tax=Panagrolaimus sp. PS1159 TaxID=55785 RepID=A0AC35F496_9BILA
MPLVPRYTYCDFHFVTLGNDHVLTYRCYLDANWHERTAFFTWIMLAMLILINFLNLLFWILWAIRMKITKFRKKWVMKKWLHDDEFQPDEKEFIEKFAKTFKMGNILLFYFIEAHTDRVVASAFAKALYCKWVDKFQEEINESYRVKVLHQHEPTAPPLTPETDKIQAATDKPTTIAWPKIKTESKDIGWKDTAAIESSGIEESGPSTSTISTSPATDKPTTIAWPKIKTEAKDIGWKDTAAIESSGIEESGPSTSTISTSVINSDPPPSSVETEQSITPKNSRFYRPNISLRANSKTHPLNTIKLPKEKKKQKEKDIEENGEDPGKFYAQKKCTIS